MTEHVLKINPYWFNEIKIGNKPWEIRVNDRNYKSGDWLILFEFTDKGISTGYSGEGFAVEVIQVYNSSYLPSDNFVIMSIGPPEELADEYKDQLAVLVINQNKIKEVAIVT